MNLNDLFPNIFVINVDSLIERMADTSLILHENDVRFQRFSAIVPGDTINDRVMGCKLSHLEVISLANRCDYDNVLILEDDIWFDPKVNHEEIYENLKDFMGRNTWDLLYLGGNHEGGLKDTTNPHIKNIRNTKTTHAYAVNKSCYQKILSFNSNDSVPIDDLLIREIQSLGNSFCVYPRLISQRAGQSFILNDYRDNNYCLRD